MSYKVAVVGATGMVGRTFVSILQEKNIADCEYTFFSSARSAGTEIEFSGSKYTIEELTEQTFDEHFDFALFSAGGTISEKYAPIAAKTGCVVIDNSSTWRMDKDVPLVVPEVNPEDALNAKIGIIANPNCSTIQAMVALNPLKKFGLKRVIYSTYQAVSGSGRAGYLDLLNGLKGEDPKNYPHQIAGNCLPHIDSFLENGYTKEEMKMIEETRKILHNDSLLVTATTVRVPVFNSHSESINVEFENDFDIDELIEILKNTKGLVVQNDSKNNEYPLAINATGKDEVFVGRIRRDFSVKSGINFWCVADNIRKGAALNAVQILEFLINNKN